MNLRAESSSSATRTGRNAVEVPHVPGRATWFRGRKGTTYLRVDAACCFCGTNHAHITAGARVSGCERGVYIVDVPISDLSGGDR